MEQVRRTSGLSQMDFAASVGISRTTLHKYVRNESDVSAPVLAKLLELYHVDPLWLLEGEDAVSNRQVEIMEELGAILADVEERIEERKMRISVKKRWLIVCRLYAERLAAFRKTGTRPDLRDLDLDQLLHVAA